MTSRQYPAISSIKSPWMSRIPISSTYLSPDSPSPAMNTSSPQASDTRRKQSRRDEVCLLTPLRIPPCPLTFVAAAFPLPLPDPSQEDRRRLGQKAPWTRSTDIFSIISLSAPKANRPERNCSFSKAISRPHGTREHVRLRRQSTLCGQANGLCAGRR